GMGRFVKTTLTEAFKSNPLNMIGALIARGALKSISKTMNPSRYNGGSLLGLRGVVIKSHGSADKYSYEWAIRRAFDAVRNDVLARITTSLAELMPVPEPESATRLDSDVN
ncbi:MAG: phosphate acyltransferase, partial [Undibacterium sp.]|nr:phosphate acyltransferase [Undibacterium sp.]